MRLTLRTLLAWLDGVLPPEEQQLLGERVAGSNVAAHIVERIRAAVARGVLPAPRVAAKGIADDPNSVAEYLDNALPSERLEPFERVCIESEMHLAEVAACHGILASVARSPARNRSVSDDDRRKLQDRVQRRLVWDRERPAEGLAGDPEAAAIRERSLQESRETARALRVALDHSPIDGALAGDTAERPAGTGDGLGPRADSRIVELLPDAAGTSVPAAAPRSSAAAWVSAALAAALLIALGGVLGWSVLRSAAPRPGREVAARDDTAPPAAAGPAEEARRPAALEANASERQSDPAADAPAMARSAEPPAPPAPAEPAPAGPPPAAAVAPAQPADQASRPLPADPAPPAPAATPGEPAAVPGDQPPPASRQPGNAPPPNQIAATAVPAAVPTAPAGPPGGSTDGAHEIGFVGADGVLLRRASAAVGGEAAWTFLPPNSPLRDLEDLLVPPGFQPELNVGGVTVRLMPATRARLTVDADGTPRITVVFGRLVARSGRADARLGITAAGLSGTIEAGLTEPVAVQVELVRFPGTPPGGDQTRVRADVVAASRGIVWRQTAADGTPAAQPLEGIDVQGMLPAGTALVWDSAAPRRATVSREPSSPAWVTGGVRPDRLEKAASDALAAKVAASSPVTRALRELATDKRSENRMAAAATLSLLGEFDELVELLCADSPAKRLESRQWLAFESSTVPLALAGDAATAAALRQALDARGPNGKADSLWSMACGFSDAQIFAGEDRALVDRLEDPSLVVRRYAHKCLVDIVQPSAADRLRYRPDAPPDLRREGVSWWRSQAEKGLIRRPGSVAGGSAPEGVAERPNVVE